LISKLGLDWKLIIAQIVNFSILAFFLTKFLYKPIIKILDERKKNLEEDEKKSCLIEERLKSVEVAKEEVLIEARKESEKIIKQSERGAKEIKEVLTKEAQAESEKIRSEAKKQIQSEREKMMEDVKKELGGLISLSIEKALGNVSDKNTQSKLVEEAVSIANKK
jgi:F-type H+-transporting ATPase subunit b